MHKITKYYYLSMLTFFIGVSIGLDHISAQNKSLFEIKKIEYAQTITKISDSLTIIPQSVVVKKLNSESEDTVQHHMVLNDILISPQENLSIGDQLLVSYRTLYNDLQSTISHIDLSQSKQKDKAIYIGYEYSPYRREDANDLITAKGLDYDGSFSRGFSFGNSQSLLLNSAFNLQLAGDLGNGIRIKAAISDDNIPIQPEGNTQVLQDFDQVFIQVEKESTRLIAGDFQEQESKSYFLKYLKKLKGLKASHKLDLEDGSTLTFGGSFAQSQGKFSRQTVPTTEGNQGPYRLNGNNGELFLIVRSGTEKIYYDGKLLKRGIDQDYTISYDRAELTFTPKILITKDSRIVIEFEYLDRSYQRTSYIADARYEKGKFTLDANLYTESDSKNLQQDIQLDSTDIQILTNAGDDIENNFRPSIGIYQGEFDPDLILYRELLDDNNQIYYEYSTNRDSAIYVIGFSNVGINRGSYVIDTQSQANGRVYTYVGNNMGSFNPVKRLIAPQQKQIMTLAGTYHASKSRSIKAEIAVSQVDLNRFSIIDNDDNTGAAFSLEYTDLIKLDTLKNGWTLHPSATLEYVQKNFSIINPYRSPEFSRDWNQIQANDSLPNDQQILMGQVGLHKAEKIKLDYTYKSFTISDQYKGTKQIAAFAYKDDIRSIKISGDLLNSESVTETTRFLRPTVALRQRLPFNKNWILTGDILSERNERKVIETDSLKSTSFAFNQYDLGIQNAKTSDFYLSLGYQYRNDDIAGTTTLKKGFAAHKYSIASNWKQNKNTNLNINLSYRTLTVLEPTLVDQEAGSNILGRMDYNWTLFNGGIRSNTSYNLGSGQELKREFEYVEVERGEGNYIWVDQADMNGLLDGEQQQSEFISDTQSDTANFIIVTVFNNEFIRTNTNGINQSIRVNPSKFIDKKNKQKWLSLLRRLAFVSNLRLNQKTLKSNELALKDFFSFNSKDTNIVRYDGALNTTLFVNRGNPSWDIQLGNRLLTNVFTQVTGLQARDLTEYTLRLRLSPRRRLDLILYSLWRTDITDSELFENRDFNIQSYTVSPELSIRPNNDWRFSVKYERIQKEQQIRDAESLISNNLTVEATLRSARKYNIKSSLSYVDVQFSGAELNTPIAFELLNGLREGKNFLWNLSLTKRMANNVDLIVNYEGRKTGSSQIIHTARAQVKATF